MKSRMSKTTKCFLVGAACMAFCTTTASADIVTFWKTDTCPDFGGQKVAVAWEVGAMQALIGNSEPSRPYCRLPEAVCQGGLNHGESCSSGADCPADSLTKAANGIGGPFCTVNVPVSIDGVSKVSTVFNADVVAQKGDFGGVEGQIWTCVICQYEDKFAIPAISTLGTIILMAGLLTAAAYRIGKKQRGEAVA